MEILSGELSLVPPIIWYNSKNFYGGLLFEVNAPTNNKTQRCRVSLREFDDSIVIS